MHEHTREWPLVSWKDDRAKILTLGFETHEPVSVNVCIQMFVERERKKKYINKKMMRKKRKEKRACGFFRVHVDNTLSRARYPRP